VTISRETRIAVAVAAISIGALAVDHLIGEGEADEDPFPVDLPAFLVGSAVVLSLTAVLFRVVVPRSADAQSARTARAALACSVLAVVTVPLLFLAVPFPFAGAGIALGLIAREGERPRLAGAAIVIGAAVIALGVGAYVAALAA
jgi:hypothetical protein